MSNASILPLKELINKKNVVSFDIFDTLITRNISSPRDIFRAMNARVREMTNNILFDFSSMRVVAQNGASEIAKGHGIHEVTLDQIYDQLHVISGIAPDILDEVKQIEIDTEAAFVRHRPVGKALFEYAISASKMVILVSDMYLPRSAIEHLLRLSGIKGYNRIYLSSELLQTKKEGGLYDYILSDLAIDAGKMIHFGDNPLGDFKSAKSRGVEAFLLDRSVDYMNQANDSLKATYNIAKSDNDIGYSVIMSLIANKFFDEKDTRYSTSVFRGSPYQMGYMALGTMMISFCSWLHREAKRNNTQRLLFLSRDGLIMKRVYDELFKNSDDALKTEYVFCSRRSTRVPLILRPADYYEPLRRPIYATTIAKWLSVNYGLDGHALPVKVFDKAGIPGPDFPIGAKFNKELLKILIDELLPQINEASSAERNAYQEYLAQLDFGRPGDAVVDIGYAGTMQNFLSILTGKEVQGYYFAVFGTAQSSGVDISKMYAYAVKGGSDANPALGICTHRFLYESLTCSDEDTFVKMTKVNDAFVPVHWAFSDDARRKFIVSEVHEGCVQLAKDFRDAGVISAADVYVSPSTATAVIDSYFRQPMQGDVSILGGVEFSDLYGPSGARYLTTDANIGSAIDAKNLIWKESLKYFKVAPGGYVTGSAKNKPASSVTAVPKAVARKIVKEPQETTPLIHPELVPDKITHVQFQAIVETGVSCFLNGELEKAGDLLAKAFYVRPFPHYARAAGECYGLAGDFKRCLHILEEALRAIGKNNRRLQTRIGMAENEIPFSLEDDSSYDVKSVKDLKKQFN